MKLTFLGTGTSQGVPVIGCDCDVCQSTDKHDKRLRTSALVQVNQNNFVIDSGPDFRYQMLRSGIKKLDSLIFTHEHKDHIAGMDDIRPFNFILKQKVNVYATERVEVALKREYPYVFEDFKYPGVPEIELHIIDENPFEVNGIQIEPLPVLHYQLPVFGFKIDGLCYITDANHIPDETKEKIKNCKVLVINALRKETHVSHFNLEEALALIKDLNPEKAYLTHISHQLGKHHDVEKELPSNVFCAYDELEVVL
ncbi:MAG: MBL fold metallo-hydrolase [Bacteroidia bacterium]|nr:MBL fold metallo-hydrolase [Bacteroidia bacterium]